jgi:hypothetical protein
MNWIFMKPVLREKARRSAALSDASVENFEQREFVSG